MLREIQTRLGAQFAQFQGVEAVAAYSAGPVAEYLAAKTGVALMERSFVGRIELGGADRVDFVQRMSTNDVRNLTAGAGLQTVLTTPEARVVDVLTVYAGRETLLCLTSPQNRAKVLSWYRRNVFFRDKLKPVDVSDTTSQLSLFGPRSAEVLSAVSGQDFSNLPSYHSRATNLAGDAVLIARVPSIAGGGYDLICPASAVALLWETLLSAGAPFGILPIGTDAFNMLRLESNQPLYGYELSEDVNPLEAGLRQAISFAKGCYAGQEVIARLDTYRKLKQNLFSLRLSVLPHEALPLSLRYDGVEVGQLTSVARLPDASAVVGLGYIRAKFNQLEASLRVGAEEPPVYARVVRIINQQIEVTR